CRRGKRSGTRAMRPVVAECETARRAPSCGLRARLQTAALPLKFRWRRIVRRGRGRSVHPVEQAWVPENRIRIVYHSDVRRIRLTFVERGESVEAELLMEDAPQTCALLPTRLPMECRAIHGMCSGAEVFAMVQNPTPSAAENLVQLPLPGELLYFYDECRGAVGSRKPVGEGCFVYGRGVVLRGHEGVPGHALLFARVAGGW